MFNERICQELTREQAKCFVRISTITAILQRSTAHRQFVVLYKSHPIAFYDYFNIICCLFCN